MTLGEMAARLGGTVRGDASVEIGDIHAIEDVDASSLTFAVDEKYLRAALTSRAAAVMTEAAVADAIAAPRKPLLVVPSARVALAALLAEREQPRPQGPYRHPSAVVDPTASIGPDVYLGAHVAIGARAAIGAECVVLAGAVVGADAVLGRGCTIGPRAVFLDACVAGDRVVLQAGAVVGADGFGYAFLGGALNKIPQIGNVVLGDDVEIGANACVDRAQTGATTIGTGTKIDNFVQIGHNCQIGKHCGLAAMVGIAGSTKIGDYTVIGGQAGVNGHITIGSRVRVAGGAHVWNDVADGSTVSGQPARDHRVELRAQVRSRDLEKLYERVSALERER
ncbi:MAG: UDP-3-O-(3-hydroxymyristoyl)glucosamine N-acyltransferase [Vulcanimicrobiaceae bacterium]